MKTATQKYNPLDRLLDASREAYLQQREAGLIPRRRPPCQIKQTQRPSEPRRQAQAQPEPIVEISESELDIQQTIKKQHAARLRYLHQPQKFSFPFAIDQKKAGCPHSIAEYVAEFCRLNYLIHS